MISVMEQADIDAGGSTGAGDTAAAAAAAGDNGTGAADQGLTGFHGLVARVETVGKSVLDAVETGGKSAIDAVESDARDLVVEAMRKLGAVHVAFDQLEVSLGSEIRSARDNVASAIVSVARHLAG